MLVIAHRGASELAPENTLLAFKLALDAGIEAIEFDIQAVKDKQGLTQLVAIHDRYLYRITNRKERIKDCSFEELRAIQLPESQQLATLSEILALAAQYAHQPIINIELKTDCCTELALAEIDWAIAELNIKPEQFLLSSFFHANLQLAKQTHPWLKTGALIAHTPIDFARCAQLLGCYSINVNVDCINAELVEDAHRRGLNVYVYTVDQPQDIKDLIDLNVDGIFSNHPERAKALIAQCKNA